MLSRLASDSVIVAIELLPIARLSATDIAEARLARGGAIREVDAPVDRVAACRTRSDALLVAVIVAGLAVGVAPLRVKTARMRRKVRAGQDQQGKSAT